MAKLHKFLVSERGYPAVFYVMKSFFDKSKVPKELTLLLLLKPTANI